MPPTLVHKEFSSQNDKLITFYHNSETPIQNFLLIVTISTNSVIPSEKHPSNPFENYPTKKTTNVEDHPNNLQQKLVIWDKLPMKKTVQKS